MNYDIVGIGNALVDIQTKVDDELLEYLNFTKGGMTLTSQDEQNELLEKLQKHPFSHCSGGSAANTIHGIGALGGKAYYIGKVANDSFGRHYTNDMANCHVGFPGPDAADEGTGTSVVLITPDAQRTMVTHLGISTSLHPDNVDETILKGAKMVYIEGYLWTGESTREAAVKMAKYAKEQGIPVAFTLSDGFVISGFRNEMKEFIEWYVDILFCNDAEGKVLAETEDEAEAFETIQAICNTVFFTRNKEGAWAGKQGEERTTVKGYAVKNVVDTTGAGDLFAAGALTGLLHHRSLRESAILGCYCASQVITHLGGRLPAHSHKNINHILKEYEKENG